MISDFLSFITHLQFSDFFSFAAFMISVATYFHTRRAFAATYFPKVQCTPKLKTCSGGNCFSFKIKNLSHSYSLTDMNIDVSLSGPNKFPFFGKSIKVLEKRITSLDPQKEEYFERVPENQYSNLEEFFIRHSPDWIQAKMESFPGKGYHLLRKGQGLIHIHLMYFPGVTGTKRICFKKKYRLIPKYLPGATYTNSINSWAITE